MAKQLSVLIGVAIVLAIAVAGLPATAMVTTTETTTGATATTTMSMTTGYTVNVSTNSTIGDYLVDGTGRTLYNFSIDSNDMSACNASCLALWPIFYAQQITVPSTLNESDFSTITATDGSNQTAFKGMPLYYFAKDTNPGDVTGQGIFGFGGYWYVVSPNSAGFGNATGMTMAETTTTPATTAQGMTSTSTTPTSGY
jgi:predicted lipoprotein with Yx(FWY)xxD motif